MKIAVLIAGEYREFEIAHKFWPFLSWDDVDCYMATWDTNEFVSSDKSVDVIIETITPEKIQQHIKLKDLDVSKNSTESTVNSGPLLIDRKKVAKLMQKSIIGTGPLMIDRWKTAIKLMQKSLIQYDRVILIRPDIALDVTEDTFRNFITGDMKDGDLYGIISYSLGMPFPLAQINKMSDLMLIGTQPTLEKLLDIDDLLDYEFKDGKHFDIHNFLAKEFLPLFNTILNSPIRRQCIIRSNCRDLINPTYDECMTKSILWWEQRHKVFYCRGNNIEDSVRYDPGPRVRYDSINIWDKYDYMRWHEASQHFLWWAPDRRDVYLSNITQKINEKHITYNEGDIQYFFNRDGFRCPEIGPREFTEKENYNTILIGGCSVTEGTGLPEEHLWHSFLTKDLLRHSNGPIAKFNVGKGGRSIDAIIRYIYVTIEHKGLLPDVVYLLLPPVFRQQLFVLDNNDDWALWDFLGNYLPPNATPSMKVVYNQITRTMEYRQLYNNCFRNLLLLKWFLASKNIPMYFSSWLNEFEEDSIRNTFGNNTMDVSLPDALVESYIPVGVYYDDHLTNPLQFKQTIARDFVHFGPNSHREFADKVLPILTEKKDFKKVIEKWKNYGK
jgi:hypothetical protein